jgi:hypothetical protein
LNCWKHKQAEHRKQVHKSVLRFVLIIQDGCGVILVDETEKFAISLNLDSRHVWCMASPREESNHQIEQVEFGIPEVLMKANKLNTVELNDGVSRD